MYLLAGVLICLLTLLARAEVKVAPYYSLNIGQGASVPTKGEWMYSLNLVNDLGVMVQPDEAQRFIGFYELKYTGPGLRREEGEKFTDRSMDHVFILRHHYSFDSGYMLKSQIDYMTEYKRTGANEIWGTGLYDFDRYGGAVFLDKKLTPSFAAGASLQYHSLKFPNYTDLLAEFQAAGEEAESSSGKQNHVLYQAGLSLTYLRSRLNLDYAFMDYAKQKVITETVQPDHTYYSSDLQQDRILSLSLQHEGKLANWLAVTPSMYVKSKTSNQNYQHFTTATSTVPVQYIGNYYDYSEFDVALPVAFLLSQRWEFGISPELNWRYYAHRPPRDTNNTFLNGQQMNNLFILTLGFTCKPNDVTRTTFFYTYQCQSSNMKFEKYLPYNYAGSFFGVNFNYTY
jgi:hypothetical protein